MSELLSGPLGLLAFVGVWLLLQLRALPGRRPAPTFACRVPDGLIADRGGALPGVFGLVGIAAEGG